MSVLETVSVRTAVLTAARACAAAMTVIESRFGTCSAEYGRSSLNRGIYPVKVCDERKFSSGVPTGVIGDRQNISVVAGIRDRHRFAVNIVSEIEAGYSEYRFRYHSHGKMILTIPSKGSVPDWRTFR